MDELMKYESIECSLMEKENIHEFMEKVNKLNKALDEVAAKHKFTQKCISAEAILREAISSGFRYYEINKSMEVRELIEELIDALQEAFRGILKFQAAMESFENEEKI